MKRIRVPFGNSAHAIITAEAERDGVPVTWWIAEAAIERAVRERALRGDDQHAALRQTWEALYGEYLPGGNR